MSQAPPPPPPPAPPVAAADSEDGERGAGTGSSFEYVHTDKEAIITEIKSLGKQEYLRHQLTQTKTIHAGPSEEEGGGQMVIVSAVLQPVLQNGPICGLAALAMVAPALQCHTQSSHNHRVDVAPLPRNSPCPIYEEALRRGFTKRGEMFSAYNMADLAKSVLNADRDSGVDVDVTAECVDTGSMTDVEIKDLIVDNCMAGGFFLVPYDADRNHRPGQFKGHKAHWCVVMGCACAAVDAEGEAVIVNFVDPSTLRTSDDTEHEIRIKNLFKGSKGDGIFVVTRQSKSKHVGLWPLRDLLRSNGNLVEIAPQILAESHEYVLAPIGDNLRNKIVLIK